MTLLMWDQENQEIGKKIGKKMGETMLRSLIEKLTVQEDALEKAEYILRIDPTKMRRRYEYYI